jgi:hypothetical protein
MSWPALNIHVTRHAVLSKLYKNNGNKIRKEKEANWR